MANTYVDYTATASQTDFAFSFPYLEDSHVVVEIDGIDKTLTTDYTIVTSPSTKTVLTSGATAGQLVRVKRVSGYATDLVDFVNGSVLNEADLDKAYLHNRYLNEEAAEGNFASMQTVGGGTDFNAESNKIVNLATPTVGTDAANKNYIDDRVALGASNLNGFDKSTHTGDNTLTEFTLSFTPQSNTAEAYLVTIDGVVQIPTTAYSVSTSTNKITFTSAPPTSANIVVVPIGTTSSASDATVTQSGTATSKTLANWTNDLQSATATGSTASRTLADRFADVVNVLDYGATGNGSTDDTTAIQAAINATSAGGTLYIPKGTYKIDVNTQSCTITDGTDVSKCGLLVSSSIKIVGDLESVLKAAEGAAPVTDNYILSSTAILFIEGIKFDGDRLNVTSSYGVQINASGSSIRNCKFVDFDGSPVLVQGTDASTMINTIDVSENSFENNGNTVFFAWVDRFKFINNSIFNASEGLDCDKLCTNGQIIGNSIETFRGTGADAGVEINGGQDISIANNVIRNFKDGVILNGKTVSSVDYITKGVSIVGNVVENSEGYGVTLGGLLNGNPSIENTNVVGNVFKNNSLSGVLARGKNIIVKSNQVNNSTREGILIQEGNNINIEGNVVTDNGRDGIKAESASIGNLIISNNIVADNNTDAGVYNGIHVTDVTYSHINNNIVTGSHDNAIRVQGTGSTVVSTNTTNGYTTGGIRLASTVSKVINGANNAKVYPETSVVTFNSTPTYRSDTDPSTYSSSYYFEEGDIVWKVTQAASTSPGWVCVTSGSPGTFKSLPALGA